VCGNAASDQADEQTDQNRAQSFHKHKLQHGMALRTKGDTDANLLVALGDKIGEKAVEADRSQ